eukprot:GFYU01002665.1.p1 GENE.GFYU01002665.1~~GFYU01002665.1.p1  ORF type:complete len:689 (-),score=208.18 GFYU01002665.1:60-2126(-)
MYVESPSKEKPLLDFQDGQGTSSGHREELDASTIMSGESAKKWDVVKDLDSFFTRVYAYYVEKGYQCIVATRVLNACTMLFVVGFTNFLLLYVDWGEIAKCTTEDSCQHINAIRKDPIHEVTAGTSVVIFFDIFFMLFWLWTVFLTLKDITGFIEIKRFYRDKLNMDDVTMSHTPWHEVVEKIVELQKQVKFSLVKDMTSVDIANRIMRKENYMIAMINKDVFKLSLDIPIVRNNIWLTKSLEWIIYQSVLGPMFNSKDFTISKRFLQDRLALKRRFVMFGYVGIVLSPFVLVFMVIYFVLKYAEEFKNRPNVLSSKEWTPIARWKFREFNELSHVFDKRMNASYEGAEDYMSQHQSALMSIVARFITFVMGSFAGVIIIMSLYEDSALLYIKIFGRNLLWYIAIFSGAIALTRGYIVVEGKKLDPETAMKKLYLHTHYMPKHWRGKCHTEEVRKEFSQLFVLKPWIFLQEIAGVILTPFILWFTLPMCVDDILAFIKNFTVHVDGVGDICSFASFDFEKHGNIHYGAHKRTDRVARSRQGKMEKSYLNFRANYPTYVHEDGQKLLSTLSASVMAPPASVEMTESGARAGGASSPLAHSGGESPRGLHGHALQHSTLLRADSGGGLPPIPGMRSVQQYRRPNIHVQTAYDYGHGHVEPSPDAELMEWLDQHYAASPKSPHFNGHSQRR